ncbi:c-type cytochrome [bacterium]|nr:c-type cytochrome [bacterium]
MNKAWLLLCLTLPVQAQDLELRQNGKPMSSISLAQLKKLAPPVSLKLDKGAHNYWVVPVKPLLDRAYQSPDYGEDISFVFICKDGYRSPVKAEDLKKFPAYLAFASSDDKPFELNKKTLGPFYLVWDTEKYPQRKTEGNWPFQVTAIERIKFSQVYSRVLPPPKSSPQVQHGFAVFRKNCLSCHQINGQGGAMAIDLNSPLSVTEYIKKPYLLKIIDNPQSVRARATMPGLDVALKGRQQAISDIVAYLEAKAAQRRQKSKPTKPGK